MCRLEGVARRAGSRGFLRGELDLFVVGECEPEIDVVVGIEAEGGGCFVGGGGDDGDGGVGVRGSGTENDPG